MFDLDDFLSDCIQARAERQPQLAIKEVLDRALRHPEQVAAALPATRAELLPLHATEDLTVLKVVWAPGMRFRPHNHLMWAAIGLYGGREDNTFYRRAGDGVVESGGRQLATRDIALLGDDVIHAVTNPLTSFTGAIHIYGGDLTRRTGRSEWDEEAGTEGEYDFDRNRRYFESLNTVE
jgi:predicted metal-dependent enzyme (double-stranded beta helix superfamily)